jgi:RNA polymerase sigma factor (TIGR02999 family)
MRNAASPGDVTCLLLAWSNGNREALDDLLPVVYRELRRIAARYFRHERPDHTLEPTGLVHEAYLKLIDQQRARWQNRAQFFGVAAQVMRRILVDHARTHVAAKRGGGAPPVALVDAAAPASHRGVDVIALDQALTTAHEPLPGSGSACGTAVLRWHDDRGDRRGAGHLAGHREAPVGSRESVAAS